MSPMIGHMTTKANPVKRFMFRRLRTIGGKRIMFKGSVAMSTVVALIKRKDEDGLISAVENGVPAEVAHSLSFVFDIAQAEVAGLLGVSPKTAQRWRTVKADQRLTRPVGEKAIRLLQLRQQAIETFEDEGDAVAWLNEANEAFGGRRPIEHAQTELGCQQVERLLVRIDEGIYS